MAWKLFERLNAMRLMIEFNAALIGVCEAILQMQSYRNGYFVNSLSFYGLRLMLLGQFMSHASREANFCRLRPRVQRKRRITSVPFG